MSKLFKLRLSFILLIVGIGLIPTAFLAKGYFQDQVPANASETLFVLKNEGISYLQEEYKGLCISEILPQIVKDEIFDLEDVAKIRTIPKFLLFAKNETINGFPRIINGSKAEKEIDDVITLVQTQNFTSTSIARNQFFNNYEFQDNYSTPIEGVSEYMMGSVSLNYSGFAIKRLIEGYTYPSVNGTDYPGITTDPNFGRGINNWLEFYSIAKNEPKDGPNRTLIQFIYNCSWSSGQLQNLSAYIKTYLWNVLVFNYYDSKGIAVPAEYEFYAQWANISFYNAPINLNLFSDIINRSVTGLEAGYPDPTNIISSTAINLWDLANSSSFVNDTGFLKWETAMGTSNESLDMRNELSSTFNISQTQLGQIITWLFTPVKQNLVPNLIKFPEPYGYGMNTTEYSEILLYEQWANGTILEDGILLKQDYKGFEACIVYNYTSMEPLYISKTNISLEIVQNFFDETNSSSFIHKKGILKWIEAAEGDVVVQNELISTFNLNIDQINLINNWLLSFRYNVIPHLVGRYAIVTCKEYRNSLDDFAEIEFYRQWANGSLFTEGIDIAPFLSLQSPIKNFEIGIPTPLNLNCVQSRLLWDEDYQYSFVNRKGISLWYEAVESLDHFNTLKSSVTNFNLTDSEINTIINWLIYVRDNYTLQYTQLKYNLPANYYIIADWYFMGIIIGAIGFASVGLIVGVIVLMFPKKR